MATTDSSNAIPEVTFAGTNVPVTPAYEALHKAMDGMNATMAFLYGARALFEMSEHTASCESLCYSRALVDKCIVDFEDIHEMIDLASGAEYRRNCAHLQVMAGAENGRL